MTLPAVARQQAPRPARPARGRDALRVGMVAASLDIIGGHGVQVQALEQGLTSEGIGVDFVPINPRPPRPLTWVRRVPYARTALTQARYWPSLRQLQHVDVAHVFSASYWSFLLGPVPAVLAALRYDVPVVLHYHSGEADDHLANWGARVHPFLRRVQQIVVPSRYLEQVFARHGYRALVIPNIVDTSRFAFRERSRLRPRLLSNRNLEPYYRVDVTVRAFALLKARHPDATLVLAGSGSQERALRELVAQLGVTGVTFAGPVPPASMPSLFADADVFVNASVLDNQPVSVLEAFASGCAVVSTGAGDLQGMLDGGRLGVLVPQDDPRAMCDAIGGLLQRPEEARAMAWRARGEVDRYTWRHVRPQWTSLYSRLSS